MLTPERVAELERLREKVRVRREALSEGGDPYEFVSNGLTHGEIAQVWEALAALLAERKRQGETFKRQLRLGTKDVRHERDVLRAGNKRLRVALEACIAYFEASIGAPCDACEDIDCVPFRIARAALAAPTEGDTDG